MINALPLIYQKYVEDALALECPTSGYDATVGKTRGMAWLVRPNVWAFVDARNRYRIVNDWDIVVTHHRITKATLQAQSKVKKQPKKAEQNREVTRAKSALRKEAAIAAKLARRSADLGD